MPDEEKSTSFYDRDKLESGENAGAVDAAADKKQVSEPDEAVLAEPKPSDTFAETEGSADINEETVGNKDPSPNETAFDEHLIMYYENSDERADKAAELIRRSREQSVRRTLVFSLVGMFFSLFFGVGIVFSIIAFIRSGIGLKKFKSTTLVWAKTLAAVGIVLSAIFIISVILFIRSSFYSELIG